MRKNVAAAALAVLLIAVAGCAAPASDRVILYGEPLDSLPDSWLCWRSAGPTMHGISPAAAVNMTGGAGLVIYQDGRAEAVVRQPKWGDMGGTRRRSGTVPEPERAEILKLLDGPLAPPAPPKPIDPKYKDDFGARERASGGYEVVVRQADGKLRRVSYEHVREEDGTSSGGEPLHPLLLRILKALPE